MSVSSHGTPLQHHFSCCLILCNPGTILVEEYFLVRLFLAYFYPENSEMRKFTQLDWSAGPHFCIIHKFSVALLAILVYPDATLQLVIP